MDRADRVERKHAGKQKSQLELDAAEAKDFLNVVRNTQKWEDLTMPYLVDNIFDTKTEDASRDRQTLWHI